MNLDLTDTPALTLLNPWAYAITNLGKRVENRTWPAPQHVDRVLIHAGKSWDAGVRPATFGSDAANAPRSAIVAVARLAYVCQASVNSDELVCQCGEWASPRQMHWRLDDAVLTLRQPVPCRGALKLWRPDPDVLRAVEKQVA